MGRKSSIMRLAAPVKQAIDGALKDGRCTLDELICHLREQYPQQNVPSRSSLGRYKQRFDALAKDLRETREIADIWAQKFGAEPDSDVGKVVLEILRTLSYRVGADLLEPGAELDSRSIAQLARAMQYIEDAGRLSLDREAKVRKVALDEAARRIETLGTKKTLDPDALKAVREQLYGA